MWVLINRHLKMASGFINANDSYVYKNRSRRDVSRGGQLVPLLELEVGRPWGLTHSRDLKDKFPQKQSMYF